MKTLYTNGAVVTMDPLRPQAQALVTENNRILGVGDAATMTQLAGDQARVVDMKGGALFPGFIETHNHISMYALYRSYAYLGDCETIEEVISVMAAHGENRPDDAVVVGYSYDDTLTKDGRALTRQDLEGLIGTAFRLSLANVLFSVDMLTDGGYVKPGGKTVLVGSSTTQYFKAALHWTFADYLDRVLLPHWRKRHPGADREALIREIGLTALSDYLGRAEKIGVVHNADDIILAEGDLAHLRATFGDRARIWPSGGHLGNMLHGPNVDYMVRFFKD